MNIVRQKTIGMVNTAVRLLNAVLFDIDTGTGCRGRYQKDGSFSPSGCLL